MNFLILLLCEKEIVKCRRYENILICIIGFGHYCACNITKAFFFFPILYDADMADDRDIIYRPEEEVLTELDKFRSHIFGCNS